VILLLPDKKTELLVCILPHLQLFISQLRDFTLEAAAIAQCCRVEPEILHPTEMVQQQVSF
jgi:hypothetical protein